MVLVSDLLGEVLSKTKACDDVEDVVAMAELGSKSNAHDSYLCIPRKLAPRLTKQQA